MLFFCFFWIKYRLLETLQKLRYRLYLDYILKGIDSIKYHLFS
nr:MAG TPA: hypothetical protein [Caudoviricetes sp.]